MAEKWDGVTRAADIARVLIRFISEEDKRIARTRAYGDVGQYLKKRHGECFHGGSVGDDMVQTDSKGVTVEFDFVDGGDAYELTWNKAAKLICGHIYDDEYDEDEEDDDDDEEEVTDVSPIESPKEYMSENAKYAYTVHAQIVTGAQMVEDGLYQMAKGFKIMRDEKLYKELGYSSFEQYCETETKISRRQVYKYISIIEKLPSDFVNPGTQNLGVRKLYMLTTLTDEQREEIVQSADLESTTVKELQEKIRELTGERDRERVLKEDWQQKTQEEVDRSIRRTQELQGNIRRLEQEIKELESRPIEVGVDLNTEMELQRLRDRIEQLTAENKELLKRPVEINATTEDRKITELMKTYSRRFEEVEFAHNNELHDMRTQRNEALKRAEKAEFEMKFKAAEEFLKLLCDFVREKGFGKEKVRELEDMINEVI